MYHILYKGELPKQEYYISWMDKEGRYRCECTSITFEISADSQGEFRPVCTNCQRPQVLTKVWWRPAFISNHYLISREIEA